MFMAQNHLLNSGLNHLWSCFQSSWLGCKQQHKSSLIRLEAKHLPTLRLKKAFVCKGGFLLRPDVAASELLLLRGASDDRLSSSEVMPSDVSFQ